MVAPDTTQALVETAVLSTMLLEHLERSGNYGASDEFMVELRALAELDERVHDQRRVSR
jgi:hypothetical protein